MNPTRIYKKMSIVYLSKDLLCMVKNGSWSLLSSVHLKLHGGSARNSPKRDPKVTLFGRHTHTLPIVYHWYTNRGMSTGSVFTSLTDDTGLQNDFNFSISHPSETSKRNSPMKDCKDFPWVDTL